MARRRILRPDEAELWANVARSLRPMHNAHPLPKPEPKAAPSVFHKPEVTPAPPEPKLNRFVWVRFIIAPRMGRTCFSPDA